MERLGAYLMPGGELSTAVSLARRVEELGYESAWVTHSFRGLDSFVVLAAYAGVTRTIALGNGVVPIYPRHPVVMAQEALTLAELSGGRFRLGIGVSHQPAMEGGLGLEMGRPLDAMREYVAVVREALTGKVAHAGARYAVSWQSALVKPPEPPPLLLAGLSSRMLELAGEIGDGVILWLCTPSYIRDVVVPAIERGRKRADKSLAGFDIVAAVPVALADDVESASARFKAELVRYLTLPFYRAMLISSGFEVEIAEFDRECVSRDVRADAVPDRLAAALGAIGDRRVLSCYVADYREAGVTLPLIRPIGFPEDPHYLPALEAAIAQAG